MQIKVINRSTNPLPSRATPGSAGLDLRANLENPIEIPSLERRIIPTGLYLEFPSSDYEAQIRTRSGLASKKGLAVLNSPGTIDSDYRGEIRIILINLGKETAQIKHGERIAQMVIARYQRAELVERQTLSHTERGDKGFGSTGLS